jgi:hypothetical protein
MRAAVHALAFHATRDHGRGALAIAKLEGRILIQAVMGWMSVKNERSMIEGRMHDHERF